MCINQYKNVKKNLLTCIANIYFNRQCIARNLIPIYEEIQISNTLPAARHTRRKYQTQRIRDEIKFLYAKKQNLNYQLYQLHVQICNSWVLKYYFHYKPKNWINELALESEIAIHSVPPQDQEAIRYQVARNIESLYKHQTNPNNYLNRTAHNERKVSKQIKYKLSQPKAIIVKADKGNTIITLSEAHYHNKTKEFIDNSNFKPITSNPTNTYQKSIKQAINKCNLLIPKELKWKYSNLKPTATSLRSLIKFYKAGAPIRPIVNWQNAPAYKIAHFITDLLKTLAPLTYTYNVKNSAQQIEDLQDITCDNNLNLASFDTKNMYTNMPTSEVLQIIKPHLSINTITTTS
ncbi:hypothetical protein Cfor_05241 [Coptotermes formosanus]|uniref:Reverse transcriptase domain-containing protein n=1 Tax=Coptotermes formosanus TaxID=36987 RepID=A0A6L2PZ68_COPFO|nr:hypothetical protein Cfor_05241 [Coptotermes formosanus]